MASDFFIPTLNHSSASNATIVTQQCGILATMVEYGERLVQVMQERNVKARDLARVLKVTYQAVKKVMDGKSSAFNAVNHAQVAKYLGVSSDWLALGEGPKERSAEQWPLAGISPQEFALLKDDDKAELEAIIRIKLNRFSDDLTKKSA